MVIPEFKTRNLTSPMMKFVQSCPFLEDYNIDLSKIGIQRVLTEKPDSNALDYIGSFMMSKAKDIRGNRWGQRQANFQLWLMRRSSYDVMREEVAEFLFNFEQWVEHCQAYDLVPKLSTFYEGKVEELMWADNGVYFSEWEGEKISLYMVQLHIIYFNDYPWGSAPPPEELRASFDGTYRFDGTIKFDGRGST